MTEKNPVMKVINKKREWINLLPTDMTEKEFAQAVWMEAKQWEKEAMEGMTDDEFLALNVKVQRAKTEQLFIEKFEKKGKPELTDDFVEELFYSVLDDQRRDKCEYMEYLLLPRKKKHDGYRRTCRNRDGGGSCPNMVEFINVFLPLECKGGADGYHSDFHAKEYDENYICNECLQQGRTVRHSLYKELYFPELRKLLEQKK